jgi:exonuclease SbcC
LIQKQTELTNNIEGIKELQKLQDLKIKLTNNLEDLNQKSTNLHERHQTLTNEATTATNHIQYLKQTFEALEKIESYKNARLELTEGSECPLCGSTKHPYLINIPVFEDSLTSDISKEEVSLKALNTEIDMIQKNRIVLSDDIDKLNEQLQNTQSKIENFIFLKEYDIDDLQNELKNIDKQIEEYRYLEKYKDKKETINSLYIELDSLQISIETNQANLKIYKKEIEDLQTDIGFLKRDIIKLVGSSNLNNLEENKKQRDEELQNLLSSYEEASIHERKYLKTLQKNLSDIENNLPNIVRDIQTLDEEIKQWLQDNNMSSNHIDLYFLDDNEIIKIQQRKEDLKELKSKTIKDIEDTQKRLNIEIKKSKKIESLDELLLRLDMLIQSKEECEKEIGY